MTSTFGRNIRITVFGEAQGECIGITCDGLPAGLPVDPSVMEKALLKRFGTVRAISQASVEELSAIVPQQTAQAVYDHFKEKKQ